jgi:hypothetical protein
VSGLAVRAGWLSSTPKERFFLVYKKKKCDEGVRARIGGVDRMRLIKYWISIIIGLLSQQAGIISKSVMKGISLLKEISTVKSNQHS